MEIRSARSFNAIPATIIRGVFNLYISNLLCKMYCKYFNYFFIYFFLFDHCKFFSGKYVFTYILHFHLLILITCNFSS